MAGTLMTIGRMVERTGLSLRSIRYYEEVGLVVPVERSKGGHRLYDEAALERLLLIMKMKPLDFSLEEMGALIDVLDAVRSAQTPADERVLAYEKLAMYNELVKQRWEWLQERLTIAEKFRGQLQAELNQARQELAGTGTAAPTSPPAEKASRPSGRSTSAAKPPA